MTEPNTERKRDGELLRKHRGAKLKNWLVAFWTLFSDRTDAMAARLDRAAENAPDAAPMFAGIIALADGRRGNAAKHFRYFADTLDGGDSDP